MPSSPRPNTAGATPPGAAPAVVYTSPWERHPAKGFRSLPAQEVGAVAAVSQEARPRLPWEEHSEAKALEHEEKVNKYQAVLAARLKAKYFSRKAFDKGDVFEEITIQSEIIRLSRRPFTCLFADPAKFCREKSCTEKDISPSLTAGSSAKGNPPSLAGQASSKK